METGAHQSIGRYIVPINYKLHFKPDLRAFRSKGRENILLNVKKSTNLIKLHAKGLRSIEAEVSVGKDRFIARIVESHKDETISLILPKRVKGRVNVNLNFWVENDDKMYGFYRSKYQHAGKDGHILTTHFEPADARAAFLCIDEPSSKATFDIAVTIDKELDAISNMPKKSEKSLGEKKTIVFERTPKMSTYLVYIGVGKFEYTSGGLGKLKINVVTTPGKKAGAIVPLEYAKKFIKYFQDYFGVAYPLPKIDLIAVPDFPMGAMENWGAITFRETRLLCEKKTSEADRRDVAETIAHELAHQWFGDLVTMEWWNDLWLNESFATYMSSKAMETVMPEWRVDLNYLSYAFETAFSVDGLRDTHPISVKVKTVDEVAGLFDRISYRKGGSVLCMLDNCVGKDVFRKGLNIYLTKYRYSNASKHDLWNAIDLAAKNKGLKISHVMEEWIDRPGHPIITVKRAEEHLELFQTRFMFSGNEDGIWPIPVQYETASGDGAFLMKNHAYELKIMGDWIKLNHGQHGFYRVEYDDTLLDRLGKLASENKLSEADVWGVENDLFAMTLTGKFKTKDYIDFVKVYLKDPSYPVCLNLIRHIIKLCNLNYRMPLSDSIKRAGADIARAVLNRLGWYKNAGEALVNPLIREEMLIFLGSIGDSRALNIAKENLYIALNGGNVDPDLLQSVYSISAINGNEDTFDMLIRRYKAATSSNEREELLVALAMFRDKKLLRRAFNFSKSYHVRKQDSFIIEDAAAFYNPLTKEIVWNWVKENWKDILRTYAPITGIADRYVQSLSVINDPVVFNEIKEFFSKKENYRDDLKNYLGQTIEKIELNMRYLQKNA